jgi:hypothetical protein
LACFCDLIWFKDWFFRLRSIEVLVCSELIVVFSICFSSLASCLLRVLGLVFVKLFCWMICLVLVRVSSPGILYGAASTVWLLWVIWMFLRGEWSDSTVGPLVRFHTGVLERVVIGHMHV